MAIVKVHALVANHDGIGVRIYDFEASDNFLELPVDEIVEGAILHIGEIDGLKAPLRYELNFANSFPERQSWPQTRFIV